MLESILGCAKKGVNIRVFEREPPGRRILQRRMQVSLLPR